jgi:hypothetical protein
VDWSAISDLTFAQSEYAPLIFENLPSRETLLRLQNEFRRVLNQLMAHARQVATGSIAPAFFVATDEPVRPVLLRRMREQRRNERLRGLANLRDLDLQLPFCGLHPPRAIAVSQPRVQVAKAALVVGPALIAGAAQPGVELVFDRALDDQSGTELRELTERLARGLADSNGKQLVDLSFNLRRRR